MSSPELVLSFTPKAHICRTVIKCKCLFVSLGVCITVDNDAFSNMHHSSMCYKYSMPYLCLPTYHTGIKEIAVPFSLSLALSLSSSVTLIQWKKENDGALVVESCCTSIILPSSHSVTIRGISVTTTTTVAHSLRYHKRRC